MDNLNIFQLSQKDNDNSINTSSTNPIKGILNQTPTTELFFSRLNVDALQQTIRYEVYKHTNNKISNQDETQLFIIMRSKLLEYGDVSFNKTQVQVINEVKKINKYVVDYSVNRITSEIIAYNGYIHDINSQPMPMELPKYLNKNNFTYELSQF